MNTIIEILKQAVMITVFVLAMMLLIEYITVKSKGKWNNRLKEKPWLQIIIAALLGIVPGCLGTFATVSLYTHKVIGMAALVTTLIATSGDEAFVMFSMMPKQALLITAIILATAIIVGTITMLFIKNKNYQELSEKHIVIHTEDACVAIEKKTFLQKIKNIIWQRALLIFGGITVVILILTGFIGHTHSAFEKAETHIEHQHTLPNQENKKKLEHHEHNEHHENENEWGWERVTYLLISLGGIFVIVSVPDHFLAEHIWKHVIKKHLLRLFLWTLGAFTVLHFLNHFIDVESWVKDNLFVVLLVAVAIGIIPESGPHIIFITLFASGILPLGIVVANSIVQDGHGAIPLLAESRKSFIIAKLINAAAGLLVGGILLLF